MILSELAKYLQSNQEEIIKNKSCNSLLCLWLRGILEKRPKTNVEKVIHKELSLLKNPLGDYLIIAKSQSGRTLSNAMYKFALSYEQYVLNKWLMDKNANDFNNNKKED